MNPESLRAGSLHFSDAEFISAVENCTLPGECFHHADHVRLAWLYIRGYGEAEATERIAQTIRRFASHHGSPQKYDDSHTRAWMRRVAEAVLQSPEFTTFEEFAARNQDLLNKSAMV